MKVKIRYIGHSGFLVEWETCYWLFDYYIGDIPALNRDKKLFVFVSHEHQDHFNPYIFDLGQLHGKVEYVLSAGVVHGHRGAMTASGPITSVEPEGQYTFVDDFGERILLTTLRSTDLGVAFLLKYGGKTLYHAGDLNLWVWKEESKQYNLEMTTAFEREMNRLRDVVIDVAFVPLDPRQEEYYYFGLEAFLTVAKVKHVFPMHFGEEFSLAARYKAERKPVQPGAEIVEIKHSGQEWEIDI